MIKNQLLHTSFTKVGSWSTVSLTGSRSGTVTTVTGAGNTLSFTATDSDILLIAAPAETYDARLQVNIDGVDTKVINLKGISNHNPAGMAQETVTVYPLAFGLPAGSHTIILTTLDPGAYKVDCIESKTGTLALDNSSILGMGDSITYQGGSPANWPNTFNGFVTQLASYYGKTQVNFSEGSATLDQIAANYWNHAKNFSTHPYLMTLMGGVNDYFDGIRDASLVYRIGDIVDLVRSLSPNVQIRLGDITWLNTSTYPGGNAVTAAMNAAIHDIAVAKGVYFADTAAAYTSDSYVPDGVHPIAEGHTLLFQAFRDAVNLATTTTTTAVPTTTTTTVAPGGNSLPTATVVATVTQAGGTTTTTTAQPTTTTTAQPTTTTTAAPTTTTFAPGIVSFATSYGAVNYSTVANGELEIMTAQGPVSLRLVNAPGTVEIATSQGRKSIA